jgi:hypothetical protein
MSSSRKKDDNKIPNTSKKSSQDSSRQSRSSQSTQYDVDVFVSEVSPEITVDATTNLRRYSIGSSGGSTGSCKDTRRQSLGGADGTAAELIPSSIANPSDNNLSLEIRSATVRRDNTDCSKTISNKSKTTMIPPSIKIDHGIEDESIKLKKNTASTRSRNIFHSLSIQPSFLSLTSKNSGSQKLGITKKIENTIKKQRKSSIEVKSPSSFSSYRFWDGSIGGANKTIFKTLPINHLSTTTKTTNGEAINRSRVASHDTNLSQNVPNHPQSISTNSNNNMKPKLQRNQSIHSRNTTRSAGPIDVDSAAELYRDDSLSSDRSITITPDQSSHYRPTVSTAMIPVRLSTSHVKQFFDFLPCVDDDDIFCPPLVDEVGTTLEQVSPTQLGVRRFGSSVMSSSSNISFTFSEGGASTTDISIVSAVSEGPVDVDGFISKDSYYLYDKHYIVVDETDISRGLVGYEVGFEPELTKRKESSYTDYKKVSNLWKVPSAIYEEAAEEVNESEDDIMVTATNTTQRYNLQSNHSDLQFLSKVIDRIDVDEDDEYDDNYRFKKRDNTCRSIMFSL